MITGVRQSGSILTLLLTLVSIAIHGLLPSILTLVTVHSAIAIMNFSIWCVVNFSGTIRVFHSVIKPYRLAVLATLAGIIYVSPWRGGIIMAFIFLVLWAVKVHAKINIIIDPYVLGTVSFIAAVAIFKSLSIAKYGDAFTVYQLDVNTTSAGWRDGGITGLKVSSQIADATFSLRHHTTSPNGDYSTKVSYFRRWCEYMGAFPLFLFRHQIIKFAVTGESFIGKFSHVV